MQYRHSLISVRPAPAGKICLIIARISKKTKCLLKKDCNGCRNTVPTYRNAMQTIAARKAILSRADIQQ